VAKTFASNLYQKNMIIYCLSYSTDLSFLPTVNKFGLHGLGEAELILPRGLSLKIIKKETKDDISIYYLKVVGLNNAGLEQLLSNEQKKHYDKLSGVQKSMFIHRNIVFNDDNLNKYEEAYEKAYKNLENELSKKSLNHHKYLKYKFKYNQLKKNT